MYEVEAMPGTMPVKLPSYPKVYAIGHAAIRELFADPVVVQEKVDGSQFSFGLVGGEVHMRSKGAIIFDGAAGMFEAAAESVKARAGMLREGVVYRGEYLAKPKHNAISYARTPRDHVVLFDMDDGQQRYASLGDLRAEADRLGLEVVPDLYEGPVGDPKALLSMLERESFLGGVQVEGVVVKSRTRFTPDGKAMMGKFVSEQFKETNRENWKRENPGGRDVLAVLGDKYRNEARWQKAVQHLRERGELEGSPRDIGKLMVECREDITAECKAEIMEALWKWAAPQILRRSAHGLPEWYKRQLLEGAFWEPQG